MKTPATKLCACTGAVRTVSKIGTDERFYVTDLGLIGNKG